MQELTPEFVKDVDCQIDNKVEKEFDRFFTPATSVNHYALDDKTKLLSRKLGNNVTLGMEREKLAHVQNKDCIAKVYGQFK